MDPVSLILTALVAGASVGLKDVATSGVRDAYSTLRGLILRRFEREGPPPAGVDPASVLAEHESDPKTWEAPLAQALASAGADRDDEILRAAKELLRRSDPDGSGSGKYVVDVRGAQGVQIGDHGSMRVDIRADHPPGHDAG